MSYAALRYVLRGTEVSVISAICYLSYLASRQSELSLVLKGLMQAVMRLWQYAAMP